MNPTRLNQQVQDGLECNPAQLSPRHVARPAPKHLDSSDYVRANRDVAFNMHNSHRLAAETHSKHFATLVALAYSLH